MPIILVKYNSQLKLKLVIWIKKLLFRLFTTLNYFIAKAKWALASILLIILTLLTGLGYFITATQSGAQLALQALPYVSNYRIHYDTMSGTLLSNKLNFNGIHIQSSDMDLYAKKLNLNMSFFKLLIKKIDIKELNIDSPSIIQAINSVELTSSFDKTLQKFITKIEKSEHLSWKSIFSNYPGFDFSIDNLKIEHLHFISGKQHYDIERFSLHDLDSQNKYLFSYIDIKMPEINLQGTLAENIQLNWAIQIKELNQYFASLKGDLSSSGQWKSNPHNTLSLMLSSNHFYFDSFKAEKLKLIFMGNMNRHTLSLDFTQAQKKFQGALEGQFEYAGANAIWQGQIKKIVYGDPKYKNIEPTMVKFKLISTPEKSLCSLNFNLLGKNYFNVDADISHQKPFNINGKIIGEIQDLNPVSLWSDLVQSGSVHSLQGKGLLNLSLQGNLAHPKIIGQLLFNHLQAYLPKLNTSITFEQLGFYDLGTPKMNIKALGKMGKGAFQLEGYAKKDPVSPELKLALTGLHLLISNTSEYQVHVSPNLLLSIDKKTAVLSGQIHVPAAKITPKDHSDSIIESEDVVLIKNHKRIENTSKNSIPAFKKLKTNIDIVLGENILFEGYGLTTKAQGQVKIETRQDNTSKATGKINLIKGRYGAYGHYFSLSHGQLLFQSDPILDPKIDVRAERTIQPNMRIKNNASLRSDIVVGMQLTGRLSKLQTKLYSNPYLNDREIISYLILGHGQSNNTGADGDILMEAVTQLTTAFYPKSKRLTEKKSLYDRLKLDWNIGQSPFDDEGSEALSHFEKKYVNIGKRLSDKLYIQYSLGLADKVSVYSIQYLLGKHLILEAKTDSQSRTAADLLFTFESG